MRSKIITYGVVAVVIIIAAFLVWHFVFSGSGNIAPTATTSQGGGLPTVGTQTGGGSANGGNGGNGGGGGQGGSGALPSAGATTGLPTASATFGVLSDEPVLDYYIDAQNNVTIVEPDGKIATIANGQPNFLSSSVIQGVRGAAFSYDGKKVFINFGDPTNPQTSIFDIATKAWTPLAAGIISPAWSRSDYRIAYLTNGAGGMTIVSTLDVSRVTNKPVALVALNAADQVLTWPNKNDLVLSGKPSAYAQASVWLFDLSAKTLALAVPDSFGVESAWSATTGTTGLVLSSSNYGQSGGLMLLPTGSTSSQSLTITTLPSKCVFNYETPMTSSAAAPPATTSSVPVVEKPYLALYCAVPANGLTGISPDAYLQSAAFTSDNFFRINTISGMSKTLFSPSGSVDAENMKVANGILFFVNRYDLRLYAISLSGV